MPYLKRTSSIVAVACLLVAASACDDPPAKPAAPEPSAAATPSPAPEPTPAKPSKPERPTKLDTELTDARRAKIEQAHPEAKGFLVMKELEDKLKAQKKLEEEKDGMKAFDALAKGKWVLFTGPLSTPTDDGFSIGVSYTPLDPRDRMGISRKFFLVGLSDVKGFDKDMKAGTQVAVIAKYEGEGKASPAFELVAENNW